jgi:hypothetical protein
MRKGVLAAIGAALVLLLAASPAAAVTFTVTSAADTETAGTLRQAILDAESNANEPTVDVIQFDPSVTAVDLESNLPTITTPLTISGPGATSLNIRRKAGLPSTTHFATFLLGPDTGVTVTIQGLTVSGDDGTGLTAGAIFKTGVGMLILDSVVVRDNTGSTAGGLYYNEGLTSIRNSTFSGNHGTNGGGAIVGDQAGVDDGGDAELINSTLDNNTANQFGGGINLSNVATMRVLSSTITHNNASGGTPQGGGLFNNTDAANFEVANTLIAGNLINGSAADDAQCFGVFTSGGYNLRSAQDPDCSGFGNTGDFVDASPLIDSAPASNGGSTPNVALLAGSPAINAGNPAAFGTLGDACPATDQRGLFRGGVAGVCDIGSYELNASSTPPTTGGTTQPPTTSTFNLKAAIRKCKRKFPKGPKRKKCIKRAKRRAQG